MPRWTRILALVLAVLAAPCVGCGDRAAGDGAAAPEAGPFCTEHGVYESVCTICHPELTAQFQAKGDWCAEHGLPESVCPKCRASGGAAHEPGEGPAPATEPPAGGAPSSGTMVYIKNGDPAARAGIECRDAGEGLVVKTIEATARLAPDPARHALINARAPGVVVELRADTGDAVKAGDVLGSIESAEAGAEDSRRRAAATRVSVAEDGLARQEELLKLGLATQREVSEARRQVEDARADLASANAALGMIGRVGAGSRYAVTSPIDGVVTRRSVTVGALAASGDPLFEVIDPSRLIAEIDVPETASADLAPDQSVTLMFHASSLRELRTRLRSIDAVVDPVTRMARARAVVENTEGLLRANMHANARIEVAAPGESALIPRDAIQTIDGVALVFACVTEDSFEVRRVELGVASDDTVAVLAGVDPGEPIVTAGSFRLKTELMRDALGDGCCGVVE